MDQKVDRDRRRFLGTAAMTMAAAQVGMFAAPAEAREPREFTAIGRATEWINSQPLTAASLLGKVVVVDFCTYTCINWLRTLPYIRAWARKYTTGLVLIGVHTPEFAFERDTGNVRRAMQQMKIDYPVVIDNDYVIWRAFNNRSWPALYCVDPGGRIRHRHFGEGEYASSERAIQRLLAGAGYVENDQSLVSVQSTGVEVPADWSSLRSGENYVGYARTQNFASPNGIEPDRRRTYVAPKRLTLNEWALAGEWTMGREATVLNSSTGRIVYRFHARDVHLVMAPSRRGGMARFRVSIDGQPPGQARGGDVDAGGNGAVDEARLYQLVRQQGPIVDRQFEIEFLDAGVEAFAFTFG